MDKAQALHSFWSGFDLAAYDENTVPPGTALPYLTYEVVEDSFDSPVSMTASLWYRSTSWAAITTKAHEIEQSIGLGGVMIPYTGGALWVKRGSPFIQRMSDPDADIRRIVLQIETEYLSED